MPVCVGRMRSNSNSTGTRDKVRTRKGLSVADGRFEEDELNGMDMQVGREVQYRRVKNLFTAHRERQIV